MKSSFQSCDRHVGSLMISEILIMISEIMISEKLETEGKEQNAVINSCRLLPVFTQILI